MTWWQRGPIGWVARLFGAQPGTGPAASQQQVPPWGRPTSPPPANWLPSPQQGTQRTWQQVAPPGPIPVPSHPQPAPPPPRRWLPMPRRQRRVASVPPAGPPDAGELRQRALERNKLRIGIKIGEGGQGAVFTLQDDPSSVFKQYYTPIPHGAQSFSDLIGRRAGVEAVLGGAPVEMAWPERLIVTGTDLDGYVMPKIGMEYSVRIKGTPYPANFGYVFDRSGPFAHTPVPTQDQRRQLGLLVAVFLDALHRNDLTYGDMSWNNMLFRLTPTPGIFVLDVDGMRPMGRATFTGQRVAQTPDWFDPLSPDVEQEIGSFDLDRYKLALLIYRLLIARSFDAKLARDLGGDLSVDGASPVQGRAIKRLLSRAMHAKSARPTAAEWVAVLS